VVVEERRPDEVRSPCLICGRVEQSSLDVLTSTYICRALETVYTFKSSNGGKENVYSEKVGKMERRRVRKGRDREKEKAIRGQIACGERRPDSDLEVGHDTGVVGWFGSVLDLSLERSARKGKR
jgi:hypothetical protein